ncbi:MAG: hypothetical protein OEV40_29905 [Acidimicrobiia bacterium]|nr:hypothetical protein [Acidimicrobiia bacterium]
MTGDELYGIVETYARFGDHHTGTSADWATAEWLSGELASIGATVSRESFEFDRYVVSAELRAPMGAVIPSVPVFYSFVGSIETADVELVSIDERLEGRSTGLEPYLDGATAPAVVLAIKGPTADPIQCNRVPVVRPDGPPAVIVAADRLDAAAGATLAFEASTERSEAPNVVAELGQSTAPPVTITTPLSGWTPAAGERGTGLAVALALAADLATEHQVRFVACSGHELDHVGLQRFLGANDVTGQAVIHLGASVGAVEWNDGRAELGRQRLTLTTATGDVGERIGRRVADANWTLADREPWGGEGANWRAAGGRVLSFLGGSSLFHTAGDVAAAATTPRAMATACEVAIDATRMFLASSE